MDRRSFLGLVAIAPFAVKVAVLENAIPKILPFDDRIDVLDMSLWGMSHHKPIPGTWASLDRSAFPAILRRNCVTVSIAQPITVDAHAMERFVVHSQERLLSDLRRMFLP